MSHVVMHIQNKELGPISVTTEGLHMRCLTYFSEGNQQKFYTWEEVFQLMSIALDMKTTVSHVNQIHDRIKEMQGGGK